MSVFSNDENVLQIRLEKARRNYQDALVFLENDYRSIAQIMHSYYPLAVLSKAAWHCYQVYTGGKTDEYSLSAARLFPVLLQSVYQSRYYTNTNGFSSLQEIRQKDWDRLKSLVDDAARRLVRAIENLAVIAYKEGKISRESFPFYRDSLYYQAFGYPIGRDDYTSSLSLFNAIFTGDEEMVSSVFHMDPSFFVKELEKISDLALNGIDNLVSETKKVNSEIREKVNEKKRDKPDLTDRQASELVLMGSAYREKLEELRHKGDSYDLFSVEMNSLLSTQQCLLFSCDASCLDDVICDGFFSAVLHPFIRFADRFYCFTGSFFYTTIAHALRKILRSTGYGEGYTSKLEKLFNHFVLNLFHQSDVEDVYTFRGFKADIILLPSMRYVNAYKYPSVFSSRLMQRVDDMKRKPQPGHVMLVVDPDSCSPLEKKAADVFHISLESLASVSLSGDTEGFMKKLFETDDISVDDVEPAVFDEVLFEDELDRSPSADTSVPFDDLPQEVLLDDDLEYDRTDDDDKARLIEARFDEEELTPQDDGYTPPRLSPETIEQYDLPESLKNEDVEEELEDLDSDDFLDDEEETVDDESTDDFLFEEIDEDEVEEEPDEGFDDEFDDPDQLLLFDDDFEPVEYAQDMKEASLEPEAAAEEKTQGTENPAEENESENSENPEDEPVNAQQEIASEPEAEENLLDDDDIIPEDSSLAGAGKSELHSGPEGEVLPEEDLLADEDFSEEDAGDKPACADEIAEAIEEEAGESEPDSGRDEESLPDEEDLLSEPEAEESLPDDDDIIPEDSSIAEAEEAELHSEPEEEVQEALQEEDLLADEDFSEEDAVDEPACTDEITEASEEEEADEDDDAASAETEPAQEFSEDEPIDTQPDEEDKTPSAGDIIEESRPDYSSEAEYSQYEGRTLPPSIGKIVSSLDQKIERFDDFLAGIDEMTLTTFEEVVKRSISAALSEQKDKMLVISPYELSFIFTGNSRIDDLRKMEIRNNAGAQMYARGRKNWAVILLVYDGMENLDFVWSESLTRASFSASDWKIVQVIGEELKKGLHK